MQIVGTMGLLVSDATIDTDACNEGGTPVYEGGKEGHTVGKRHERVVRPIHWAFPLENWIVCSLKLRWQRCGVTGHDKVYRIVMSWG